MRRVLAIAVLMLAACSSGDSKPATGTSVTEGHKVGDTAAIKGGKITVHSFDGTVADIEQCGGDVNPLWFRVALSDNRTAGVKLGGAPNQLTSGKLGPGDCARGNVAFDIPQGATVKAVVFAGLDDPSIPFAVS